MSQGLLPIMMQMQALDFAHYYPTEESCVALLQTLPMQTVTQSVYLWGPSGAGKTHLLHATAETHKTCNPCYLPCQYYTPADAAHLPDLYDHHLILLDNISTVLSDSQWQQALFNLFNHLSSHPNKRLVIADQSPIESLPCNREDLLSRLRSGTTFYLPPLSEPKLKFAIQQQAQAYGMNLPEKSIDFLLHHTSRNPKKILALIQALDQASLRDQHPLTIPYIKSNLPKMEKEMLTGK